MIKNIKIQLYTLWLLFWSLFDFPLFMIQMVKMSISLWKSRATLRKSEALPMMIVHFNPSITDPSQIVSQLEKAVSDPFKTLHGYPPVVLCMPIGMTFSSLNFESFVEIMNTEQLKLLKNAIYRKKNNIELVSSLEEVGIGK